MKCNVCFSNLPKLLLLLCLFFLPSCSKTTIKEKDETKEYKSENSALKDFTYENVLSGAKVHFVFSSCDSNLKTSLIFIHGSPGSWSDYKKYLQNSELAAQFCLISVDRPGFGDSMKGLNPPSLQLQAELLSEALTDFRDKYKLEGKIRFVGHSYGGPVVMKLIPFWQKELGKVYLLASPSNYEIEKTEWYNELGRLTVVQWFLPDSWNQSNREMITLKEDIRELAEDLKQFKTSVVLVHGTEDSLVPFSHSETFKSNYPGLDSELISIQEAGHFIPWTMWEFLQSLFLKK